jgi:hypothetical protein
LGFGDGSFSAAVLGDSLFQFHSLAFSSAIESSDEMLHVAESLEGAEFVLRLTQRHSDPVKEHRPVSPPSYVRQKETTDPLRYSMAFVLRSDL